MNLQMLFEITITTIVGIIAKTIFLYVIPLLTIYFFVIKPIFIGWSEHEKGFVLTILEGITLWNVIFTFWNEPLFNKFEVIHHIQISCILCLIFYSIRRYVDIWDYSFITKDIINYIIITSISFIVLIKLCSLLYPAILTNEIALWTLMGISLSKIPSYIQNFINKLLKNGNKPEIELQGDARKNESNHTKNKRRPEHKDSLNHDRVNKHTITESQ